MEIFNVGHLQGLQLQPLGQAEEGAPTSSSRAVFIFLFSPGSTSWSYEDGLIYRWDPHQNLIHGEEKVCVNT